MSGPTLVELIVATTKIKASETVLR
jgi:hypothetical protein